MAAAQHNVGIALLRSERLEEALEAFEAAVRMRKGALGRDHPEVAVSHLTTKLAWVKHFVLTHMLVPCTGLAGQSRYHFPSSSPV